MEGLLHATVVGVGSGNQLLEELDVLVAVDLVAKLFADLGQEAGLDEDLRAIIDTLLGLDKGK